MLLHCGALYTLRMHQKLREIHTLTTFCHVEYVTGRIVCYVVSTTRFGIQLTGTKNRAFSCLALEL